MKLTVPFVLLVDRAEQTPWEFLVPVPTKDANILWGDYAIEGCELSSVIERKSLADFVGVCSGGNNREEGQRERFERELTALSQYTFAAVVIESSREAAIVGAYRSKIAPRSVTGTADSIMSRYGVHCVWCEDRQESARTSLWLLWHHWEHRQLPAVERRSERQRRAYFAEWDRVAAERRRAAGERGFDGAAAEWAATEKADAAAWNKTAERYRDGTEPAPSPEQEAAMDAGESARTDAEINEASRKMRAAFPDIASAFPLTDDERAEQEAADGDGGTPW